jgi:chromosome partitioning protein
MKPKKVEEMLELTRPTLLQRIKEYSLDVPKTNSGENVFRWKHVIQLQYKQKYGHIQNISPKVISICQNKGGVGKTTSVINLATALSYIGKTLIVDLDGQSNLSQAFDIYLNEQDYSISDVFENHERVNDAIREAAENLYLLPNHLKFERWKKNNRGDTKIVFALKKILKKIKNDYQFILIDTPSALDLSLEMALYASNYCVIPFEPQPFSLEGITNILDEIESIQENDEIINFDLKILGIFINMYEKNNLGTEISDIVNQRFNTFNTKIRKAVAIQQAQAVKTSIFEFDENSNAAVDFYNLTFEILNKVIEG